LPCLLLPEVLPILVVHQMLLVLRQFELLVQVAALVLLKFLLLAHFSASFFPQCNDLQ
jgi:hypothetical protein